MKKIPVIGIGASAGGLKEFETFFKHMPAGKEVAIVLIQHLSTTHKSILAEIVKRYTEMDVFQVEDKVTIEAGKVYIIPSNKLLTISKGKLLLSPMHKDKGRDLPIDIFFRSLKESLGEKAIAVILSGTGSDGALGSKEVKEAGGLTIVQQPNTADFDGMPNNAIKTGYIDFIIPVEEMPPVILSYIDNDFRENILLKPEDEKVGSLINQIFAIIKSQIGHDFSNYKRNTILRRIERRLAVNHFDDLKKYVDFLNTNPQEVVILHKELLISVTSFFRDTDTFHYIEKNLIPKIVSQSENDEIRVWVPACATGEEAYSWAILFKAYLDKNNLKHELQIFASDIDTDAIEKAREGFYINNIIADVSPEILENYFVKEKEGYKIKKTIREKVIFADQNFVQDPPYSRLDLVSCRNVLIYLDNELQQKALSIFHYALKSNGTLVLGNSETLGNSAKYFVVVDRKFKIFTKIDNLEITNRIWKMNYKRNELKMKDKQQPLEPISLITKDFILDRFTPPSVVIDGDGEMIYVQGRTGKYIEIATGEIKTNIVKVAREGLKVTLMNGIRKAKLKNEEVVYHNLRVQTNDTFEYVNLIISPLSRNKKETSLFIIIFQPSITNASIEKEATENTFENSNEHITILELEKELAEKEQYLQNTIEELETTNEELKSSNEEAQSTNEELQSTNEELETSKEELQSVNEELSSTNIELTLKMDELAKVNDNLKNLLNATDIATIFLDRNMKIFNFTPAISDIIELLQTDIGRSIKLFTNNLEYNNLITDINTVLENLLPVENEVCLKNNNCFWMRIIPYQTLENIIEGVVITFTNITEKKKQEAELEKYRNHLEQVIEEKSKELVKSENLLDNTGKIANIGGWRYDIETQKMQWTKELYRIHEVADDFLPNVKDVNAFYDQPSQEIIHKAFNDAVTKAIPYDLELKIITAKNTLKDIRTIASVTKDDKGKVTFVSGAFQDITDRKKIEAELVKKSELLKKAQEIGSIGTWHLNIKKNILEWTEENYKIFGIPFGAPMTFDKFLECIVKEDIDFVKNAWNEALKGNPFDLEHRILVDNNLKWVREKAEVVFDEKGNPIEAFGVTQDINFKKEIEQQLQLKAAELYEINMDKDKFIAMLAHDLKNPLSSLLGFSDLIVKNIHKYDAEKIEKYITIINSTAKLTYTMLLDILLWSRSQSGKIEVKESTFHLKEACEQIFSELQNHAQSKRISLTCNIPSSLIIFTDLVVVKTIFRNLISNAIKFSNEEGAISIHATKEKDGILISVRDEGVGMSKETIADLFNVSINHSVIGTHKEKGTGLGLLICKGFIDKLQGKIWAESELGKGATFYFSVPDLKNTANSFESENIKLIKDELSILVVEDDEANFILLEILILDELKITATIYHSWNGKEAVEFCQQNNEVDLILMDINMPIMNGLEASIKINTINPKVPIVIFSSNVDDKVREHAHAIGSMVFERPISTTRLKEIFENTVRKLP